MGIAKQINAFNDVQIQCSVTEGQHVKKNVNTSLFVFNNMDIMLCTLHFV